MTSIGYSFLVGTTTVSNIVKETCSVIWNILSPVLLKLPTEEEWKNIANDFSRQWNFPHCILAMDGKHVVMQVIRKKI